MRHSKHAIELVVLASAAFACGPNDRARPAEPTPTYSEDVAPILAANCASCHREGGIAPFSLLTYDEAVQNGEAIRAATRARSMPPFNLDNSGSCNKYVEARWLDDAQIATLERWVLGGMPVGDSTRTEIAPPPPQPPLDRVDATLEMAEPFTPDESLSDEYRCFLLDPHITEDRFVTGFDVHPGASRMMHHLTLFAIDSQDAEEAAAKLDAEEAGPGYQCFGDTRVSSRWIAGTGPGGGALLMPAGTGLKLAAGRKTILQVHYNTRNGIAPDLTSIDLKLEANVDKEAFVPRLADEGLVLPPRRPEVTVSATIFAPQSVTIWSVWPHMHELGKKLLATSTTDGKEQCLARVDDYEFHWQSFATYAKPLHVEMGDPMKVSCTYDTSARDRTTRWGDGTEDEMCIAFFYMTLDR